MPKNIFWICWHLVWSPRHRVQPCPRCRDGRFNFTHIWGIIPSLPSKNKAPASVQPSTYVSSDCWQPSCNKQGYIFLSLLFWVRFLCENRGLVSFPPIWSILIPLFVFSFETNISFRVSFIYLLNLQPNNCSHFG